MIATVRPLAALLAGVAILLTGTGMLGSLLGVRGQMEGFSAQTLGLVMSCYFVGFLAGTYFTPGLIQRIGHIRAFAFFASATAASVLLHPVLVDPWAWALLRAVTGSALGPMLAGALMDRIGPAALPAFFAAVLLLLAFVAAGRRLLRRRDRTAPAHFHAMQGTTPSALEMLPETHPEEAADGGASPKA